MNEGLFFRRADGAEIPVKEVEGLKGNGLLILMTETFLREEDMQKMQQSIERRIGDGTRVLRGNIPALPDTWWWTATPDSPKNPYVRYVNSDGALDNSSAGVGTGAFARFAF